MSNNKFKGIGFASALVITLLAGTTIPTICAAQNAATTASGLQQQQDQAANVQGQASANAADDSTEKADATTSAPAPKQTINDPFQGYNRAIYSFNDGFDTYFMKPLAEYYNIIMPKPVNQGIHNAFNNANEIPTIINDLIQFHFYQMANDLWRFSINTTIGIGGLFDVATRIGLPRYQNDFGLTLTHYGWTDSAYWVWPFLGSYTIRDGWFGLPVDYYGFSVYPHIEPKFTRNAVVALYLVDYRANLLQYQSVFEEAAIDRYVFVRNAYLQHRRYQIEQNEMRTARQMLESKPDDKKETKQANG